jgi:hypothetical protein
MAASSLHRSRVRVLDSILINSLTGSRPVKGFIHLKGQAINNGEL